MPVSVPLEDPLAQTFVDKKKKKIQRFLFFFSLYCLLSPSGHVEEVYSRRR